MNTQTDVALILWNPDVIQLVSLVLVQSNLKCCGAEPSDGVHAIEDLIVSSGSSVVVFDLAPPYERSSDIVLSLLDRFPDCSFAMTCADKGLALKRVPWLAGFPLLQKPYEMDEISRTVRGMARRAIASIAAV